jgi:hypothetical protein
VNDPNEVFSVDTENPEVRQMEIPKQQQLLWSPKEDITAHELALCVPMFAARGENVGGMLESLPDNAKRHWELREA